jgi:hypothetical protein
MRPALAALVGVLVLGCAGRASGFPLLPSFADAALKPKSDIETVRWRHRHHHGYFWFWGGPGTDHVDRDDNDGLTSRSNTDIEATRGRRHRRDYDLNDRRSVSRDDTDAAGATVDRLTMPDVTRPDRGRRRRWVDPPPAR